MMTKPVSELTTPELLEIITTPSLEEVWRERLVVRARQYHSGYISAVLTERLREFLGDDFFTLNFSAMVDSAVYERLQFKQMNCTHANTNVEKDTECLTQQNWWWNVWNNNNMAFHQSDIHEGAVSDGEYFAVIDFDNERNCERITKYKRYTDVIFSGQGGRQALQGVGTINGDEQKFLFSNERSGVLMVYPGDDTSQKPIYALRRWQEITGSVETDYIAVYSPDSMLLFQKFPAGWAVIEETPLINPRTGQPLGIPVVHYKMPNCEPEAKAAWATQRLLNKMIVDLIIESDQNAFRIYKFFGWDPRDKSGMLPNMEPGTMIGNAQKEPSQASLEAIEGSDITKQDATIDSFILRMAQLTDTPVSRFQVTGQIAAEGTLKQQEAALIKKCERRAAGLGNSWECAAAIARRWHNAFCDFTKSEFGILDETIVFEFEWEPFYAETASDMVETEALKTAQINNVAAIYNIGITDIIKAGEELGYTKEDIEVWMGRRKDQQVDVNHALAGAFNAGNTFLSGSLSQDK